jgi:uncharacterized OsmC-like protein
VTQRDQGQENKERVMSQIQLTYDGAQHCTALHASKGKSVTTDACPAGGGKGRELSPGELVATGLAGCMLLSMGSVAQRDQLDVRGATADVDISFREEAGPIRAIDLVFAVPREFSERDRAKLQAAAGACPIKHSLHPDVAVTARFEFREPARETAGRSQ